MPSFNLLTGEFLFELIERRWVIKRTDPRPGGTWPHVTIFPADRDGDLNVHLTWTDQSRPRIFLAKIPHDGIERFLKPFQEALVTKMLDDIHTVRLPSLARDGYVAIYLADPKAFEQHLRALAPQGTKQRRKLNTDALVDQEAMASWMKTADPRQLPAMLTKKQIAVGPIVAFKPDGTADEALVLHPIRHPKGWRWEARPMHRIGGEPFSEVVTSMLFKVLPENFCDHLALLLQHMGLDDDGETDKRVREFWGRARALDAA